MEIYSPLILASAEIIATIIRRHGRQGIYGAAPASG